MQYMSSNLWWVSFTSSRGICNVSATLLVRSWKSLKSSASDGREGITASSGEEKIFIGGVVSSSSLASYSSNVSLKFWGSGYRGCQRSSSRLSVGNTRCLRSIVLHGSQYGHWGGEKGMGGGTHRWP